jgi:hypothetical protein
MWGHYAFEDLVQNAYLVFEHVLHHYPQVVDPPHLMALFKPALSRELINLAKRSSTWHNRWLSSDAQPQLVREMEEKNALEILELWGMLAHIPQNTKDLIVSLLEISDRRITLRHHEQETNQQRLVRLLEREDMWATLQPILTAFTLPSHDFV